MKRVLSLALAFVLLLGAYPVATVYAQDSEDIPQEQEIVADTQEEPETEPAQPELDVTEFTVVEDPGLPDNEELFAFYAQQKLYGSSFSFLGSAAGERLTGDEKILYDALVPFIRKIANGERKSTIVSLGQDVSFNGEEYTVDKAATFTGDALTKESLSRVLDALLSDLPYEMYWYAKTIGCKTFILSGSTMVFVKVMFTVADNYAGAGEYTVDTAKTGAASKVVEKASDIVAKYADKSDYEKLLGYKTEICALTDYNHSAASGGVFADNNDPWQLIHVFDGDDATKVVCEGYSKAFMYLCDLSQFSGDTICYTVVGTMNGEGHMWNIVELERKHYLVDVTNSDKNTIGQNGELFLAGAEGDPAQGYTLLGRKYCYDAETLDQWGTDADSILCLAPGKYVVCQHDYTPEVTPPTCTEPGYTTYTCAGCGDTYVDMPVDALNHSWGEGVVTTEPTEESVGVLTFTCTLCEDTKTEDIPVLEHTHQYTEAVTAPTCAEPGYTTHTCRCGDSYVDTPVDAFGHSYVPVITDPTCAEPGYTTHTCATCGDSYMDTPVDALGHSYVSVITAPTCEEPGYTTHTCDTCGDSYVDTPVDALGHAWDAGEVTKESTFEETGIRTYTCTVCGGNKTEEIPARNHDHQYTTLVVPPTYTKQGYTVYTCICGQTYQGNFVKAKGLPKPNVKVSNDAKGDPVLSWTADGEASYYRIYRATSKNGTYKSYAKTTKNTYTDKSTTVGKTYYYKVRAICSSNSKLTSAYSTYDKAYSKCATPAVTITVSSSTGKPTIQWKKITGAKKYTIYRATSQNGTYKALKTTTSTSYADTSVKVGTTYYYKVKAIASSSSYNSANSSVKTCVPVCARPSVTISVNSTTGKPFLKWSSISGATGYHIYRAGADGKYTCIAQNYAGISFADKTAAADTDYRYRIRAVGKNDTLNSAYSATKKIHATLAKPQVTFGADTETGKPKLTWKAVEGAVKYRVYRSSYATKSYKLLKTTKSLSYTDTSVSVGKSYYYKVIAIGASSNSAYSSYQKLASKCAQPVAAVSGREEGGLQVSWKKVTGARKYEVYRKTEGGSYAKVATVSTLSYADTKAAQNKVSYYKVRAYGDSTASRGSFSQTVSALNHTLSGWKVISPATPETSGLKQRHCTGCDLVEQQVLPRLTRTLKDPSLTVTADSGSGKPKLTWKSVDKATGYYIYLYDEAAKTYQFLSDTTRTTYSYADAVPGETYAFSIVAVNSKNCSGHSAVKSVLCKCATPKLTLTRDSETDLQTLSWTSVAGADAYEVQISGARDIGYIFYASTSDTSVQITDVPAGVQYYFKVRAICEQKPEINSALSAVHTQSRTVKNLVIHVGKVSSKANIIAWEKVKDAKTYRVYRAAGSGEYKLLKTVYSTDYVDLGVKSGTTYYYKVIAYNSDGKKLTTSARQSAADVSMKPVKIYLSPSSQIHNSYRPYNKLQTTEAIQCREIAKMTKAALERCGFEVKTNVTAEDYQDRVKESNNWGANLHVPIHTNGYNGKSGGTQVYHDGVTGSDSYKAAQAIFEALAPVTPGNSLEYTRKHSGLYECNASRAPVAYIEAEFHDSYKYSSWIVKNKEKIAEAICEGICNLYGVTYIAA